MLLTPGDAALGREWLETNGLGGYASSTVACIHTRRYHGLLVAATKPPVGRMVLLSKLEETLVADGHRYELSANRYPGVIHPQGYLLLKEFRQEPFPVFVYAAGEVELEKSVFMLQGENTTIIRYALRGARSCTLELRPLIAFRDYHATTHENSALDARFETGADWVKMTPYAGLPSLYLNHADAQILPAGDWYRNFEYDRERQRGLDFREDLFNPLVMIFELQPSAPVTIAASTGQRPANVRPPPRASADLAHAVNQFIVRRGDQWTIIAGYHWFGDWGRDTMIALPGLTLSTGRYDVAKSILLAFAAHIDQGMLPNRFPDGGEAPEYNTVDATLWFFEAIRVLVAATGDYDFVRASLYGALAGIIDWHVRGTRYGIHVDTDGLLSAGEPGLQLTWMDARIGGQAVTPRSGKPVEIQALWYNALRVMEDLARRFDQAEDSARYRAMADRARESFVPLFWNEQPGCLYDVIDHDKRDASVRPNQIFAVSLFHKMLPADKAAAVVNAVAKHLLTPYGLRTLAPDDPRYRGRYEGDPASRDGAYHQGTVWPWLMGPFISAYLYVHGRTPDWLAQARRWLCELESYAAGDGLGQVAEVFDGDAPQRAGGCIAQAWSVAELWRAQREISGLE